MPSPSQFQRRLIPWGETNRRSFPWRETRDPFKVLIAEVLLQRSRGVTVARVYEELFRRWPDEAHLARARIQTISNVIRPLGLVSRAQTIHALARRVVALGSVPTSLEELMSLPGVGRYAAGATLAVAFDQPTAVVDAVSARVYGRYFGFASERSPSSDVDLWELAQKATPLRGVREWNWAVLDLAATVCLPKLPRCQVCPLHRQCRFAIDVDLA